ncbi:MAG: hypothetical protein AAF394_07270, partial [Planctomycetota bacterium]
MAEAAEESAFGHQCPIHSVIVCPQDRIIRSSETDIEQEIENKERRRQESANPTPKVEEVVVVVSEFCRKAEKAVELARSKLNLSDAEIRERVA